MEQDFPVRDVCSDEAVNQFAQNLARTWRSFGTQKFCQSIHSKWQPLAFREKTT